MESQQSRPGHLGENSEWVLKGAGCSLTLSSHPELIKTIQTLCSIGTEANNVMNVMRM